MKTKFEYVMLIVIPVLMLWLIVSYFIRFQDPNFVFGLKNFMKLFFNAFPIILVFLFVLRKWTTYKTVFYSSLFGIVFALFQIGAYVYYGQQFLLDSWKIYLDLAVFIFLTYSTARELVKKSNWLAINIMNAISPGNESYLIEKLWYLFDKNEYSKVLSIIELREWKSNADILLLKGYIAYSDTKYEESIGLLTKALDELQNPPNNTYRIIGLCYFYLDEFGKAESFLKRYLETNKDDLEILSFLAYAYFENEKFEKSIELCNFVLNRVDDSGVIYLLGQNYYDSGQSELGIETIIRAADHNKPDAGACVFLGNHYFEKEDNHKSISYYAKAITIDNGMEEFLPDKLKESVNAVLNIT